MTPGATTTFATAELARVLAGLRASQSGSEEQKDKESEDEDTVRAFLALIDQQAGSASCRGDAPYVHHDSCGGAPQPDGNLRAVSLGPHEVNRKKGLRNGSSLAAAQAYSSASSAYRTARSISAGSE